MPDPEEDPKMHKVVSDDPKDGFAWKHEDDITDADEYFGDSGGEKVAVHKGSGYYDLQGGPQDGESVRGKGSVPDNYTIKDPPK